MKTVMDTGTWCFVLVMVAACSGEKWTFPGESAAASVRIDSKVKFLDGGHFNTDKRQSESRVHAVQSDDVAFREPTDTEGFYNRPPGAGRYPVTVEEHPQRAPYRVNGQAIFPVYNRPKNYESDGTLDSLQYCKCVSTPECRPHADSARACGAQKYLCCYKRGNQEGIPHSEYFNEIEDERPSLLPGQENFARPFPPAPNSGFAPGNYNGGALNRPQGVLVGQQGPSGNQGVLVGPEGPTGVIGPAQQKPAVLSGPNGPTGTIGPAHNPAFVESGGSKDYIANESAQRGVLVGPGGPTGIIGPAGGFGRQPVLVGPGGPTGIIGPVRNGRQGILVGPGGPTGIIGPGYGRPSGPGVLVGPGGPTGIIGPGRGVLVGPGGPTGRIGPRFFDY